MSTNSPFSIGRYLRAGRSARIADLLQHAETLHALTVRVRNQLPPDLAEHCEVIGYGSKRLTLLTHSPVWAARLRFATADLGKRLALEGIPGIRRTEVRVIPAEMPREPDRRRRAAYLSAENARLVRQAASGVRDRKLAAALRRLAKRNKG